MGVKSNNMLSAKAVGRNILDIKSNRCRDGSSAKAEDPEKDMWAVVVQSKMNR